MARKGLNSMDPTTRNSGGGGAKASDSWEAFEKKKEKLANSLGIAPHHLDVTPTTTSTSVVVPMTDGKKNKLGKELAGAAKSMAKKTTFKPTGSCYESHPALILPGTDKVLYGGSCSSPIVPDADVYIGFDHDMKFTQRHWPWKKGQELLFKIQDGSVPDNADEFKKLVDWTIKRLDAGDKIHGGCIGGHGRTGMWLAAVVSRLGEKDAITYVREHYCKKAVENSSQVDFLGKHFDIKKVNGSKTWGGSSGSSISGGNTRLQPLKNAGSIWGEVG